MAVGWGCTFQFDSRFWLLNHLRNFRLATERARERESERERERERERGRERESERESEREREMVVGGVGVKYSFTLLRSLRS